MASSGYVEHTIVTVGVENSTGVLHLYGRFDKASVVVEIRRDPFISEILVPQKFISFVLVTTSCKQAAGAYKTMTQM